MGIRTGLDVFGKVIEILAIAEIELRFLGRPVSILVPILTELSWFSFLLKHPTICLDI